MEGALQKQRSFGSESVSVFCIVSCAFLSNIVQ